MGQAPSGNRRTSIFCWIKSRRGQGFGLTCWAIQSSVFSITNPLRREWRIFKALLKRVPRLLISGAGVSRSRSLMRIVWWRPRISDPVSCAWGRSWRGFPTGVISWRTSWERWYVTVLRASGRCLSGIRRFKTLFL